MTSISFDTVAVGDTGTRFIRVAKSAYGVVEFDSVKLAGAFALDLELTTELPIRLGPLVNDTSDSLSIVWSPATYGPLDDTAFIYHDDVSVASPFAVVLQGLAPGKTGDPNIDDVTNSSDVIYLVNYVFKGGSPPRPVDRSGDVDCSGLITSADVIYLVTYVFKGGPAPCI